MSMIKSQVHNALQSRGFADGELLQGVRLRSLSGHLIPTKGVGKVCMARVHCEFCVVGELQHNFMQKCNATISYENTSITLNSIAHCRIGTKATCASVSGVGLEANYWREKYPTVFPLQGAPLNTADVVEMTINTGDAHPINQQPYRIPLAQK